MKISDITGTACDSCKHSKVCKFQEEFINAQQAAKNAAIGGSFEEDGIPKNLVKALSDIDYIEPIKLKCKYAEYGPQFNTRDAALAATFL